MVERFNVLIIINVNMSKKRCFLAIRAPEFDQIHQRVNEISVNKDVKINLVDPKLYHFTLHFFGDISDGEIEDINHHMSKFDFEEFELGVKTPAIIPPNKPNKARVLYLEPKTGRDKLDHINKSVAHIVDKAGFQLPNRQYLPHLTVARIKYGDDREVVANNWLNQEMEEYKFTATEITLIHSELTSSGPIYNDLLKFD